MLILGMSIVCAAVLVWWPFGQTREPADEPSRRWEYRWLGRHKRITRRAATGSHPIVFVGDSITQNWEDAGLSVWEQYYAKRQALNLGIASDKTQNVLWRVQQTEFGEQQPKLIVLLVGTNNSAEYSAEETASGVKSIIEVLQQKAPKAKILLMAIFPRGEALDDPRRAVNEATNEILANFANDDRITFLNINREFTHDDGSTNLELMPDALHLSETGYAAWAEAMEPTLAELLSQ